MISMHSLKIARRGSSKMTFLVLIYDEFPCSHRRPRQYILEQKMIWTKPWTKYLIKMNSMNHRVISFFRWTQYVKLEFPRVRLSRTAKDDYDACIRLDIQLSRDDLTNEESDHYNMDKTMQLSATIDQRRTMSTFVKDLMLQNLTLPTSPGTSIMCFSMMSAARAKVLTRYADFVRFTTFDFV
ncbi:hypothetical protein MPTK1_7g07230 [Marchantia polymorpha subsp. ruderalis]|uniref:Uncharacterized protein n=2 Tax=Marchantia polymorpha TaxID=3197 RepID=A0AAF6BX07_MARPO|nr:hypothetical protein MARPO_0076s0071 [Marchantia polymorpha]BBN16541.1 hypothetical protein Mp_7g07230 [Marchantia polymorpha subsp. ruderalis]|eukprot:PTQ34837.1 hypothetical protein MARPO_0076s0071 [Marchantia polymorpha]